MKLNSVIVFCAILYSTLSGAEGNHGVIVTGNVSSHDATVLAGIEVTVSEAKAGLFTMHEKVLYRTAVNTDGSFKTAPMKHRSNWQLLVRIIGSKRGLEDRTPAFSEEALDRSRKYANGTVSIDVVLGLQKN